MEDAKRQTLARIVRAGAEEMLPRQLALLEQRLTELENRNTPAEVKPAPAIPPVDDQE